jgi:hypothetical protein
MSHTCRYLVDVLAGQKRAQTQLQRAVSSRASMGNKKNLKKKKQQKVKIVFEKKKTQFLHLQTTSSFSPSQPIYIFSHFLFTLHAKPEPIPAATSSLQALVYIHILCQIPVRRPATR